MTIEKPLFVAALLAFALVGMHFLRKHSADPLSRFSVTDLLLGDDGRASKAAVVMYAALAVTTWTMVYVTINQPQLLTTLFPFYIGAWVAPSVTALIVNAYKAASPPTNVKIETVQGDVKTGSQDSNSGVTL